MIAQQVDRCVYEFCYLIAVMRRGCPLAKTRQDYHKKEDESVG
jgi:hypothetical protein